MRDKVQAALNNYVLAYENNDKELFKSLCCSFLAT